MTRAMKSFNEEVEKNYTPMNSPLMEILSPFPAPAISISSAELARCVELSQWHGLEMLFYSQLKKHYARTDAGIDDYLKLNEHSYLKNAAISMWQEAVEKEVVDVLGKQGIPACIIKGNEIARSLYDDPNCRSASDIDVLVRKKDVIKADLILRAAHYTPYSMMPLSYSIYHHHHTNYLDTATKTLIELHWNFGTPYFFRLSSEEIWEGMVTESGSCASLAPEKLLVILLIHHYSHTFRELRVLVDLFWAFHKYDQSIHWPEFSVTIKRLGLIKTTLISISQFEALWPGKTSRMQSLRELKQLFMGMGYKTPDSLISYFKMDIGRTSELNDFKEKFFARFALDDLHTTLLSYLRTLFPPPDVIRDIYHNADKLLLPINYLRFINWRVKNWTGLAKH